MFDNLLQLSSQCEIDVYQKLTIGQSYHMLNDEPIKLIKYVALGKNNRELRGFYELVIKSYLSGKTDVNWNE